MNRENHNAGWTSSASLAVDNHGRSTIGTILHPTDYSKSSRRAFELACRIAGEGGSRLIVMHVAEPPRVSSLGMAAAPPLPKGYRGAWEGRLRMVQSPDRNVRIEHRLEEGDVADAILLVARESEADMIVMAESERSWLSRAWTRSVADKVAREARCPVINPDAECPTKLVEI